ncbi:MAG: Sec-independent protein translocase protein TatB [Gammaproteobacteria bacterium]|nr:Sec-independent protein translocase protein TatB [Gammaproteobacteria bacterium]
MSGIGGSEFVLLCLIGLLILGPERLPRVARQLGQWLGKARQMTRSLQRQLEEETDVEKNLGFDPKELDPTQMITPRDDDMYSPLHDENDDPESVADENAEAPAAKDEQPPA